MRSGRLRLERCCPITMAIGQHRGHARKAHDSGQWLKIATTALVTAVMRGVSVTSQSRTVSSQGRTVSMGVGVADSFCPAGSGAGRQSGTRGSSAAEFLPAFWLLMAMTLRYRGVPLKRQRQKAAAFKPASSGRRGEVAAFFGCRQWQLSGSR